MAPALHQTLWYCTGGTALTTLAFWSVYRCCLWGRRKHLLRLERARQAERERIARELHDTLLQSVHAVILRVDTVAKQFPCNAPVRASLEHILDNARLASREARDLIQDMRAHADRDVDLSISLHAAAACVCSEFGRSCKVAIKGEPYDVSDQNAKACYRIVVECLRNAFYHAQASNVTLEFEYAQHTVCVSVSDDGIGMAASIEKSAYDRHWGILGMHERAAEVGASLTITSLPGHGTRLTLELPRTSASLRLLYR